jgi:anti-anti-sigma factor
MEITQHPGADSLEMRLTGRLDATWAEHVGNTIENAVRAGSHQIVLNFAGVDYISSLGIRVLLNHYKRLKSVNGNLSVCQPSEATRAILKAAGLEGLLLAGAPGKTPTAAPKSAAQLTRAGAIFQAYPQTASAPLTCTVLGHPERLGSTGFTEQDCRSISFPSGTFGLGLGGFGEGFADCRNRFGEFLAAGGCAITLPTNDPHSLPDYIVEQGVLIPRVETLYALAGKGDFSLMARFDSTAEGPGKIGLSDLVDTLIELSGAEAAGFVALAEAAGLVGAALRKSPAVAPVSMQVPEVRDWMSFTTERASERSLALVVGVAARKISGEAAAFLRPLKAGSAVHGHVHAAMFPYRPVQRGELPFGKTVAEVLAASTPTTLLHLMADSRPFEGVGETDLVRGACWVGPLQTISIA